LSSEVDPRVYPLLVQLGGIIRTSKILNVYDDEDYVDLLALIDRRGAFLNVEVRCEGHTDDLKLPKKAAFPSNWELSSARSLNLVRLLSTYAAMPEKHFSALGYGKFRPIIDIETISTPAKKSEARATNRRVEIYLDAFLKQKMNGEI
jgi:flagellar motor protein MotB